MRRLTEKELNKIVKKIINEDNIESKTRFRLLPQSVVNFWKSAGWNTKTGFWKIENGKLYCKVPAQARMFPWWKDWVEVTCQGEFFSEENVNENLSLKNKIKMYLNEIETSTKVSDHRTVTEFITEVEKSNWPKVGRYKVENGLFLVKIDNPTGTFIPIGSRIWVSLKCN